MSRSPEIKFNIQKISTTAEEYLREKKERKAVAAVTQRLGDIYGDFELEKISILRDPEYLKEKGLTKEEAELKVHEVILKAQADLRTIAKKGRRLYPEVVAFFKRALDAPELSVELTREIKSSRDFKTADKTRKDSNHDKYLFAYETTGDFVQKGLVISDQLFRSMLELHQAEIQASKGVLKSRARQAVIDFKKKLSEVARKENLQLTPEFVNQRLGEISFDVKDAIVAKLKEIHAEYDSDFSNISIAHNVLDKKDLFRAVIFHELLHALSGRTEVVKTRGQYSPYIQNVRTGLYVASLHSKQIPRPRFYWLNEAVTETLTWQLLGKQIPKQPGNFFEYLNQMGELQASYGGERELYQLLLSRSRYPINKNLVLAAYFEDYDPNKPAAIPAWKTFIKALNESYGVNILLILDKIIKNDRSGGLAKAIQFLKNKEYMNKP